MNIKDLLKEDSIIFSDDVLTKEEVISMMVEKHFTCGHISDKEIFKEAIYAREQLSSTGVGHMIAIPHAQNESVCYPSLVAMVNHQGVDYQSLDQQPAKVFFMIAVPKEGGNQHLEILAKLCQVLMDEKVVQDLLNASSANQFIQILTQEDNIQEECHHQTLDIVAVTACPTGIAHTYMAAKNLEDIAKKQNINIKVETNGASGVKNLLTAEEIQQVKCVIVAVDKKVEMNRFDGKELIQVPVKDAIYKGEELIEQAIHCQNPIYHGQKNNDVQKEISGIRVIYKHLMNGISQIIPILMIFGISMTLVEIFMKNNIFSQYLHLLYGIASLTMALAIPIMSASIADSISDRQGFVVALISSALTMQFGGHIIECILIGFISGYLIKGLSKMFEKIPEDFQSIVPNLLLPIIGTLIMSVISYFLSSVSIDYITLLNTDLNIFVSFIFGMILGLMMSIDMGGPINKTAYTIGIIGIFIGRYDLMSAVMLAGMVPPLVIWLAMLAYPYIFNEEEKKGKWKCFIKGLCFVSEEAIPYMRKDYKGIHIPCMISSMIAGGLSMAFGCSQSFPHGGIWVLPLIHRPLLFVLSLVVAVLVGMSGVLILHKQKVIE